MGVNVLLDWTFCVIHTFCAIQSWWRFRRPGEDFPNPWWEHEDIIKTFRKRMGDMLKEFHKKYKGDHYYVCCDCPRENIWRLKLDPNYKNNRSQTKISKEGHEVWGRVFSMALDVLTESTLSHSIVRVGNAEADDCVAVIVNHLIEKDGDDQQIHVVTGDSDLYQLDSFPQVSVWDRKGVLWRERMKGVDPKIYIEAKCYAGDTADGIPSVGTRIGIKTALGWVSGTKAWPKDPMKIDKVRLEINRNMILFSRIPNEIKTQIINVIQ